MGSSWKLKKVIYCIFQLFFEYIIKMIEKIEKAEHFTRDSKPYLK